MMRPTVSLLLVSFLLSGCDIEHDSDLRAWTAQVRQRQHALPQALPVVPSTASFRYQPAPGPDPFDVSRLSLDDVQAGNQLQPDLRRPREPLESWPLDSLRLVGSLRRQREAVALIEADKLVYPLRVGGRIGQDFGTVIAIAEKTVDIEELVADGSGRWIKRRAQLILQEKR